MATKEKKSGEKKAGAGSDCAPATSVDGAICCTRTRPETLARLARVAKALSDPIRLGMLDVMTQGRSCCGIIDPQERGVPGAGDPEGICVCEFQEQFGLAQSKASYHLRVLKDAGLVTEETRGKWSFYEVDAERVAEALRDLDEVFGLQPQRSA
jgi:ArsR family transcriptional regulator, arsenate/arsenite/antimonite-responsive transcriptional repressor